MYQYIKERLLSSCSVISTISISMLLLKRHLSNCMADVFSIASRMALASSSLASDVKPSESKRESDKNTEIEKPFTVVCMCMV